MQTAKAISHDQTLCVRRAGIFMHTHSQPNPEPQRRLSRIWLEPAPHKAYLGFTVTKLG
jgi:hypothetical protein